MWQCPSPFLHASSLKQHPFQCHHSHSHWTYSTGSIEQWHKVICKLTKLCEMWGYHSDEDLGHGLLGCDTI
jgi:hypothetical protein